MTKKLWGGRFTKKVDKDFFEFQKSLSYDYKLAQYDISHSILHIFALSEAGIINKNEHKKLSSALREILNKVKKNVHEAVFDSKISCELEDIHTYIQHKVEKKVGSLALKLHTLRSRNDQVVFDEKYYSLKKSLRISKLLHDLNQSLLSIAKAYPDQRFVGYTHTQKAQVIWFWDYVRAFIMMFERDEERALEFHNNLCLYIGAGALTGTSLTRENYNNAIKKSGLIEISTTIKPVENALDNVSDRDFIVEFMSILSIVQMHLSRLSEDLILYSTKEFNYIELPEEFCTGSSLMPHKKNPDFLELVRGYTGRVYGNLMSILTTMKGLPLTYNRDMQLDKEPLFSSVEIAEKELEIMAKFIRKIKLNKKSINDALEDKTLYATELAEWLVRKYQVPFKDAHTIVGKMIILSEKMGGIEKIPDEKLKELHSVLTQDIITKVMNAKFALSLKRTFGRSLKGK